MLNVISIKSPHQIAFNHLHLDKTKMAIENRTKSECIFGSKFALIKTNIIMQLPIILRWTALVATATTTIVMGLNKQTKTVVVAIVGTKPISQTFTAKFEQTPAFVYFIIANAIASLYNIVVVLLTPYLKGKGNNLWIHILDLIVTAIAATGAAAATSIAELGKNGNLHARWNPICERFNSFCLQGGLALIAAFIGVLLLILLNILSLVSLHASVEDQDLVV